MKKIKFIHLFTGLNCIIFLLLFNSNTKGQSVSITSNVSQICKGSAVTFTASVNPTNNLNGTYDGIRWLVSTDGGSTWQNTGERTTTYTTSSLLNNYQVEARATFATGRYSFYFVYSNIITVQVNETEIQDFNTISTSTSGSIKFNGSDQYLSLSDPPTYGTDAFTIDGWFRLKDAPSNLAPILGSEGNGDLSVLIQSDLTTVSIDAYGDHATNFTVPTIAIGVWHHLAVVRNSSGDLTVFLDGQRSSDGHQSENFSFSTSSNVGEFQNYNFLSGFLANLRIVTGSALYDPTQTTITVPTSLTTAVTNTKLLLNAVNSSSLLTDGSATQTSITNNGGATWSGGTPFLTNLNPSSNATISNSTVGGVWSSSNNSILQVNSSSGVLTPIATGNATITYTLTTNTPVTCTVTESSLISTTVPPVPPTASAQSKCTGSTVSSLVATGTNLKWYNVASGGSVVSGTTTLATGTYYVTQTINGLESDRTSVAVTVNALPATPSAGNNSRCLTGSVSISATPASGETIDWYAASSGGSSLSSGSSSYNTGSISSTTTYYAEARNSSTGCVSATRTAVTANINPLPDATISASGATTFTYGNSVVLSGPPPPSNALSLNGTSNYVSIPSGINSNFSGNQITVEGWFYPTQSFNGSAFVTEAYEGDGVVKFALFSEFDGVDQKIKAGFYSSNWVRGISSTNLSLNQWSHIAATYDQANIKIYVNGALTCTFASTNALPAGNERWLLGKAFDYNNFFPGKMDEVRIWNVARTQSQIQNSMYSTISPSTSGLVGYYKLDEDSGSSAADATGHGYTGTVN